MIQISFKHAENLTQSNPIVSVEMKLESIKDIERAILALEQAKKTYEALLQ